MEGTRKRRPTGNFEKKRVSFAVPAQVGKNSMRVASYKRVYIFGVCCSILVLLFMLWPVPKLSQHARHWHDSGYIFKYQEYDIFYQDILRMSSEKEINLQPVLLILHGFPTSSYDWKKLITKLHVRFARIVIADMLGFGFSDKPSEHEYSIKEQATIQENLLRILNVTDVHILAHDYGDTVAQELIARSGIEGYKLRFKSVCLTNGGIIPSQHRPRPIQRALMTPVLKTVLSVMINQFVFNSRFRSIFGPNTQPTTEDLNDFWAIMLYKRGHVAFSQILKYIPERHANEDRWVGALRDCNISLHLIYGPMDPINTPDGFFSEYKKQVPQSSYTMLENIGHYPQLEDEVNFIKSYNQFLDRVEKTFYTL